MAAVEAPSPAELAVQETIRRARRVYASGSGTTLSILKEADARLSAKLEKLVQKHGGPSGTFTEAQATVYRKQIRLTTSYLEKRMAGFTHEQATKAIAVGVKSTVQLARKLEKHFTGMTRPLSLDSQQMQDETVRGTGASLLRKQQSSWNRYGSAMVGDFERVLRVSQLEGLSQHEVVSRLVSQGKLGGIEAKGLHAKEPSYFPEPTGYVRKRYWAERIVRTETSHAYNAGELQAMNVTRANDFPDLQKKILATFDMRTAPDSVAVHGQVRELEEHFQDGAGRSYLHPPARPNDRETVVPWRPHWEEVPSTQPPSPKAQAKAQVQAAPGPKKSKTAKQRWQELGVAIDQAKAKLATQKAIKQAAQAQLKQTAAPPAPPPYSGPVDPAEGLVLASYGEQAKAKAAQLVGIAKAQAKAKAEAARAKKALKRKEAASDLLADLPDMVTSGELTPKQSLEWLKGLAKNDPPIFVEMWKQTVGGDVAKFLPQLAKPMLVGKAAKKIAKIAAPDVVWDKPKKPKPKAAPLDLFGMSKPDAAALIVKKDPVALEQLKAALEDMPVMVSKDVGSALAVAQKTEMMAKAIMSSAEDWQAKKAKVAAWKLQDAGAGYVDVFDGGKKLAYFKEADGKFTVTPPAGLAQWKSGPEFPSLTTTDKAKAAAYAVDISEEIQKSKGITPVVAPTAAVPLPPVAKPVAGEISWSSAYAERKRPKSPLKTDPAKDVEKGLRVDTRHGHGVLLDEDKIEGMGVEFKVEERAEGREVVVRFKLTEHAGIEARRKFVSLPDVSTSTYNYDSLADLKSGKLVMTDERKGFVYGVPGSKQALVSSGAEREVKLLSHEGGKGEDLAALHNVVEIRFPEPEKRGEVYGLAKRYMAEIGIDASRPSAKAIRTYKRAKILNVVDSDGAREMGRARSPKAADKLWKQAVVRNPKLSEIEADAEFREVAPGQHALYSGKLAEHLKENGVQWLSHYSTAEVEVLEQMFVVDRKGGMLSSRERFQRGLTFEGASTPTDFRTGGADGAFLRVQRKGTDEDVYEPFDGGRGWMIQVDPSELGRLDTYAYNYDAYGRAGESMRESRLTTDKMADLVRRDRLDSGNEILFQRQVGAESVRRITTTSANREALLRSFRDANISEVNGIPIEDFVVTRKDR